MHALNETGGEEEALAVHARSGGDPADGQEYIDALVLTGAFRQAAESAYRLFRQTGDLQILRRYLSARSQYDPAGAREAYGTHAKGMQDSGILCDYAMLLKRLGDLREARRIIREINARSPSPLFRLAECDLLAGCAEPGEALALYEQLIEEEIRKKEDLDTLGTIIGRYRACLCAHVPAGEAETRFLRVVSRDVNVASLIGTGRLYESFRNAGEARSWYYRAYRADFLTGGLAYARFLAAGGEDRECEKVMLYILSNVKKTQDLCRVASVITGRDTGMHRLRRLMDQLVKRLEDRRAALDSEGLEILAVAFFISASAALEEGDYSVCKHLCLCGMDVMPARPRIVLPEEYLALVRACKERALADRPVMHAPPAQKRGAKRHPVQTPVDQLGLDEQELRILAFLKSHRMASEAELRKLLGTRRVVGIVNRMIQKASSQGLSLIGKKGVGEEGEVYEYTGT
jgi:tetratricopeptide (TPR) repeat protein